jgi:hypothetical protein
MQKKDREIRTLRFALKKQREQQPNPAQINVMLPPCDTEDADTTTSDHESDSRHKSPPSVFVQQTAGSKPQCTRALANHTTVVLTAPEAPKPSVALPLQEWAKAAKRISIQRQPYNTAPYPAASKSAASAAGGAGPRATPNPNTLHDAAQLLDKKAKYMAASGIQKAALPPQGMLTALVGHLAGDQDPTKQGHAMAQSVNTLRRGMWQIPPTLAPAMRPVSSPVLAPSPHSQRLCMRQPVQPVQVLPKITTCKVIAATISDYDREEVGFQMEPLSAEISSSSWAAANATACYIMEATTPTAAPESPAATTDTAYVMWDTPTPSQIAPASCNCVAATDQHFQGKGMVDSDSFSDHRDPSLDENCEGRPAVVAALRLEGADYVPSAKPSCLHSLSSLRQEVAQMHQTVLTLFDPGGSYMPIDKQRIRCLLTMCALPVFKTHSHHVAPERPCCKHAIRK